MNRRSFLKGLGATLGGLLVFRKLAKQQNAPAPRPDEYDIRALERYTGVKYDATRELCLDMDRALARSVEENVVQELL